MIYFTICSKNFLGYALALRESLEAWHDPLTFYVAVCDDLTSLDRASFPFEVISLDQLGIPDLRDMQARYNISELNTAVKPFVLLYLFDRHPGQVVTYLDPDILVVSPFRELQRCFDDGANCVLTPHILEPAEFAELDDGKFLQFGIYNLGFCSIRDTPQTRRIVSWWARRLETHCVIDLPNGLFVDQKWADLFPAFIEGTTVLRHPGYNVAYWNLSQRVVRFDGQKWTVNGVPLRFFHFSGNTIEDPEVFSRHSSQFRVENLRDVAGLLDTYRITVHRHGHAYYSTQRYGFSWSGAGGKNLHAPQPRQDTSDASSGVRPHLPLLRSRSMSQFSETRDLLKDVIAARRQTEIDAIPFGSDVFTLPGTCACCRRSVQFQVGGMYSPYTLQDGRVFPNWREHLNCLSCGLTNRVRASLHVLQQEAAPDPQAAIYLTERVTPTFAWLRTRFPNTRGSEYFPGARQSGDFVGDIQHQDVQALSYDDESLDYILTFDVLEHVPDYQRALHEFFRCLRPGGTVMITVPFRWTSYEHQVRCELRGEGEIVHFMEPEYHGNPVDIEGGSLCFRYFGWQLLDELRAVGFDEAEVLSYWSSEMRYFGDPQLITVARKS